MVIEEVAVDDPRLDSYRRLTDVRYRSEVEVATGSFVLEGVLVLERALASGIVPDTVLVSRRMRDRVTELAAAEEVTILVATDDALEQTTGYHVHRGVLAVASRPSLPTVADLVRDSTYVLVLEALRDHANVGAAFRNAAAFGVDAVLVTRDCADPLYRRAVKTSMGSVLQVPWTYTEDIRSGVMQLRNAGLECVALTPASTALPLAVVAQVPKARALLVGTEGAGLSEAALGAADVRARIPMAPGPDSLNVAAATAVALYACSPYAATT